MRLRFAVAAAALLVLFVSVRGAPLGVPAADDYFFLHHQRFGALDLFDSYGAAWYWRPVSRQLYFSVVGPLLPHVPAAVVVLHAALLLATFFALASLLRRFVPEPAALAAAAFPLLAEPARVLLGWPSASQHLIAMAGVSAACAFAATGRLVPALAAMALALGSIESAAFALPLVPLLAPRGARLRSLCATAALGAAWIAMRIAVAARGVAVPTTEGLPSVGAAFAVLRRSAAAQAGLEDLPGAAAAAVAAGLAIALLAALWTGVRGRPDAPAWRTLLPWIAGGALWFVLATLPLAAVLPNWNAWRSALPGLGLAVACAALFARSAAWPVCLFLGTRALALLLAAPAPAVVTGEVPPTASHLSFVRLVRLQHTLVATRATLHAHPVPPGVHLRFWDFPQLSEFGFAGSRAVQVWLADTTATWGPFGGEAGLHQADAPVIAFNSGAEPLTAWIEPEALRLLAAADTAASAGRLPAADALLAAALTVQTEPATRLRAVVLGNRATLHLHMGDPVRADSLHRASEGAVPLAEWLRTEAYVAVALGDSARAMRAVRTLQGLEPPD